jgi:hypothetical protein
MHETGRREIAGCKGCRDALQVRAYRGRSDAVFDSALKLDPSTIRQIIEHVAGRILIDAHEQTTACLEGRIRLGVVVLRFGGGSGHGNQRNCKNERSHFIDSGT